MTEQEWLASNDPRAMCAFVRGATTNIRTRWAGWASARRFNISDRKWRLIDVACLARVAEVLPMDGLKAGLARIEALADSDGTSADVGWNLSRIIREAAEVFMREHTHLPSWLGFAPGLGRSLGGMLLLPLSSVDVFTLAGRIRAEVAVVRLPAEVGEDLRQRELAEESARQAELVRDILGNPFRGERVEPAWLAANDRAVPRLARGVYEGGRHDELPILADALEDAGCTSEALLEHCRGGGLHARGCWAVDCLLGKE